MFKGFLQLPQYLNFEIGFVLLISCLMILIFVCFQIILSRDLFKTILLMSVFSMLISICYLLMDGPDVAMTEVALGSCLSTCVLLNFVKMISPVNKTSLRLKNVFPAILLCLSLIILLIWAASDISAYGAIDSNIHSHISKYYLENTYNDTGLPAPVTAILASYRGFDTLGETTVILIAGIAVLLLLSLKTSTDSNAVNHDN